VLSAVSDFMSNDASPALRAALACPAKRLNRRPNFPGCTVIARATRFKRFHRHGFPHQATRGEAAEGADCLWFAATCPGFAARLRLFARYPAMRLKLFN
jgi:hypothetical protein